MPLETIAHHRFRRRALGDREPQARIRQTVGFGEHLEKGVARGAAVLEDGGVTGRRQQTSRARQPAGGDQSLGAEPGAALGAPGVDDSAATGRAHARTKAVRAFAFQYTGLESAFHVKTASSEPPKKGQNLCFRGELVN